MDGEISENNMADGYNLGQAGTMSEEEFAQQQQLNRRQQMASLLMQQGQKQAQGQMIGNRYVPASFFQNITPLVQTAIGAYMGNKADTEAAKLAQAIRANKGDVEQQIINKMTPQPAKAEEVAGPAYKGVAPSIQYPEQAADYSGALKMAQMNPYGAGKEYIPSILKKMMPEEFNLPEGAKRYMTMPDGTVKEVASGGEKLHTVKGNLVTSSGKVIFSAGGGGGGEEDFNGQGRFNKKGDYIAPGGVFIGKTEVAKDREIARSANELRQGLKEISPKDIKATASVFGDVNQGGPISYLAKQFENPAVAAQAKVNASSVMQTLQNLPPGPASDKDIAQARSSFPGYGNPKDLQDWVTNTNNMLERKINNVNQKYGSEDWYGAQGISTKNPNSVVVANPQDQAALSWANANPNDPRAAQIKQRLSGR